MPRRSAIKGALLALLMGLVGQASGQEAAQDLPPGHPPTGSGAPAPQQNPHAGAVPGMFEPPADTETEEAELPPGTILVELRDADDHPLPRTPITLGVLHQSVARGESREHKAAVSDDRGLTRFDSLETGSGIAYRVTVPKDAATFAALPFQLSAAKGMHVVLHVYPVTRDINKALVVMQTVMFLELKDDRVQVEEAVSVFNLGRVTWVPDGVVMNLPKAFTALNSGQQMSDQGVDAVEGQGARLRGTYPPGRHDIEFRWQLPYSGEESVRIDVGLPPHVAVMRVMALASHGMKLSVEDMPSAESRTDAQGQHLLVTEKQLHRDDTPVAELHVALSDLPTPGPGRLVATCIAALGVLAGLGLAFGSNGAQAGPAAKTERARLLAELEELERAHQSGELGPKTYERARREIVDRIALTLAADPKRTA